MAPEVFSVEQFGYHAEPFYHYIEHTVLNIQSSIYVQYIT
ncbi:hypothetical protein BPSOL_0898 [Bifidobacterium pseudolongum]|nr:hypothetical protein BPSOL_0898 [Bifidobacterium pseudolongum]